MALYTISHRCGHDAAHQIRGTDTRGERGRRAEWLAGFDCPDCQTAAKAAEHDAENTIAAALAAAESLPALAGTDRQVSRATTLRAAALDQLTDLGRSLLDQASTVEQHRQLDAQIARGRAALLARTEAGWWLDRRGAGVRSLVRDAGGAR
jgi:hypothetical protein